MNINVKYKWPKLLSLNIPNNNNNNHQNIESTTTTTNVRNDLNLIRFPLTQVGLFEMKNVTLSNPSNQNGLLIQLLFINNYPIENKNQLIEMLKINNYDFNIDEYLDEIQQPGSRKQVTVDDLLAINDSTFSIHQSKLTSQGIVILNGGKSNNKNSQQQHQTKETLSFYLQKSQQVNLQIQFQPFKKQIYSSNLIIRNFLTIIDAYIIHRED